MPYGLVLFLLFNNIFNFNFLYYVLSVSDLPHFLIESISSDILYCASLSVTTANRKKGPKTKTAPEPTSFQEEVIFGSMLVDLSAEKVN